MSGAAHGTAVAIQGWAVLLIGKSGSGKSDLALRLIDRGATLVGDDYVTLHQSETLLVSPTKELAGKLEIRGLGIVSQPYQTDCPLRLLVELGEDGERMPPSWPLRDIAGWSVPLLRLSGFAVSAPVKVEYALQSLIDDKAWPVRLKTTIASPESSQP
jgi:serine kinase of HPr protein (carbohydrate metabolism regulator)